jgi:hypothetical protein
MTIKNLAKLTIYIFSMYFFFLTINSLSGVIKLFGYPYGKMNILYAFQSIVLAIIPTILVFLIALLLWIKNDKIVKLMKFD